ncbi:MAG: hypothetical protein ABI743_06805, partial [bacterium]
MRCPNPRVLLALAATMLLGVSGSLLTAASADHPALDFDAVAKAFKAHDPAALVTVQQLAMELAWLDADDQVRLESAVDDPARAFGHLAYWPMDPKGDPWVFSSQPFSDNGYRAISYDARTNRPPVFGDPTLIAGWEQCQGVVAMTVRDDSVQSGPVPEGVMRAGGLLRPLILSYYIHGADPKSAVVAYQELHLAPNPLLLGEMQLFDQATFLQSPDSYQMALDLHVGPLNYIWLFRPINTTPNSASSLLLIQAPSEVASPVRGWRSIGSLEDLQPLSKPIRFMTFVQQTSLMQGDFMQTVENRAKLTLRALGSSQLAYQDGNRDHHYGGWGDLLSSNYIQQGYT